MQRRAAVCCSVQTVLSSVQKDLRSTCCMNIGRQTLSLNARPYLCRLQLHQSSPWLDPALFSVLSVSAKTAGHPLLNMEFWINMQLMVLAAETKTRFFSHATKRFHSP